MLFKLSTKNIKKSIKDYSIYFFTLVFAVAMFYMFNSIDAQNSMLSLSEAKSDIVESLVYIINYVSIFVSIVLGFLIIYSNNFLIKRRKKEIGLYLTLGMSKRKVSLILVCETLLIGIISLLIGLICGIGLSQLLSIFTAKLFEADMLKYKFIFSNAALIKTIIYFGIIFILVIIFNVISLSRYKLIDLLTANKKNEKIKLRNKYLTFISFILSITLIGYAYYLLFDNAILMMDKKTVLMLASGALGTFLLFFSMSGFLLKVFQKAKKIYYKNLNMFILKQVNNKINTTVFSTTIISLMLLLTIGILSGSMSLASAFNEDLKENNLTDFSLILNPVYHIVKDDGSVVEKKGSYNLKELVNNQEYQKYVNKSVTIIEYIDPSIITKSLLTEESIKELKGKYGSNVSLNFNVPIIKESEYVSLMKLFNHSYIDIKKDEYLVLANIEMVVNSYSPAYNNGKVLNINNNNLKPATDKIIEVAFTNSNNSGNDGLIVVSDEITNNLEENNHVILGNYNKTTQNMDEVENNFINYIFNNASGTIDIRTKIGMETSAVGLKAMLTFVGLYLGLTFAVCSATILAIGQLSESSDNKDRYKVLRQLGANNKVIKKSLFTQIAIAFMFPLIIAIIHSIVGLKELNSLIQILGHIDLTANIFLTALFIIILYGGYFIVTYLCSKNIIKE